MTPKEQHAEFRLVHEFDAPRELVFKAFSDPRAMNEWWGPVETKNTVLSFDFRPGGIFHFKMENKGRVTFGRFIFRRIEPHSYLEFTNAFADANANVVKAPFDIDIPDEILYKLAFTEKNLRTTITMLGYPVNATDRQIETFKMISPDMRKGFGSTFDQLNAWLNRKLGR